VIPTFLTLAFLLNVWSLHGSYFGFLKLFKLFGFGFWFITFGLLTIHHIGSMRKRGMIKGLWSFEIHHFKDFCFISIY
jgi:hypothetical protein